MKLLCILALIAMPIAALAQPVPTEADQRRACTGNAMRLCFSFIRDRDQMRSCMISHYGNLGSACRAVFDASTRAEASVRSPAP